VIEIAAINEPEDAFDAGCAAGRFIVRKDGGPGWEQDCPLDPVQIVLTRLDADCSAFLALCEPHASEFAREMGDKVQPGLLFDPRSGLN